MRLRDLSYEVFCCLWLDNRRRVIAFDELFRGTLDGSGNGDPNGFSMLGLGADQNSTTLNGMSFGGSNLPRDAGISTSLNASRTTCRAAGSAAAT